MQCMTAQRRQLITKCVAMVRKNESLTAQTELDSPRCECKGEQQWTRLSLWPSKTKFRFNWIIPLQYWKHLSLRRSLYSSCWDLQCKYCSTFGTYCFLVLTAYFILIVYTAAYFIASIPLFSYWCTVLGAMETLNFPLGLIKYFGFWSKSSEELKTNISKWLDRLRSTAFFCFISHFNWSAQKTLLL